MDFTIPNPCAAQQDPLVSLFAGLYAKLQGLWKNPLLPRFNVTLNLSLNILGCVSANLSNPGVMEQILAAPGGDDALNNLQSTLYSFIPPAVPAGCPDNFNAYFPADIPSDLSTLILSGFPDGLPSYLPSSFTEDFTAPLRVVTPDEVPTYIKDTLYRTGLQPGPNGYPEPLFKKRDPVKSVDQIIADPVLSGLVTSSGVNLHAPTMRPMPILTDPSCPPLPPDFAAPNTQAAVPTTSWVDVFNELQTLIPVGGLRGSLPDGVKPFPLDGFTGFDPVYLTQMKSKWRKYRFHTDLMSNVVQPIPGIPNYPSQYAFTSLYPRSLMLMQSIEGTYPSVNLDQALYTPMRYFSAVNELVVGPIFDSISDHLNTLASLVCLDINAFLNNLLNGAINFVLGLLGGLIDKLLGFLDIVLDLDNLLTFLTSTLNLSAYAVINLTLPRPNFCSLLNGAVSGMFDAGITAGIQASASAVGGVDKITQNITAFSDKVNALF